MVRHLNETKYLPLALETDGGVNVVKWWVDASYGVHPDMKSHTRATITLRKGSVYSYSSSQKITTKSSTESELVSVDDVMPIILWTWYFLMAQGYKVVNNVVYQDNKSTMLLSKNGKASTGKRTKHINSRYFFVTDRMIMGS